MDHVGYEAFPFRVVEDERAAELRRELGRELERVSRMAAAAGGTTAVRLAPGEQAGSVERVDLVRCAFDLSAHNLEPSDVLHVLDDALTRYRDDRVAAWLRTVNPLYWLGLLLDVAEVLPFLPLRWAGVDVPRLAASLPGRIVRSALRIGVLVAVLVGVASALGVLDDLRSMVDAVLLRFGTG